jgi:hypothetical protein
MSMVQQAIEVGAPLHTVYEQLATFENYPRFMHGVERVTRVGNDHTHWIMDLDGRRREFDATITERSPDERLSWSTTDGPLLAETLTVRPIGETRTQVVAQLEADVAFLLPSDRHGQETLSRRLKSDLDTFKSLCENGKFGSRHDTGASSKQLSGRSSTIFGSGPPDDPASVAARLRAERPSANPGGGWGTSPLDNPDLGAGPETARLGTANMGQNVDITSAPGIKDAHDLDDLPAPGRRIAGPDSIRGGATAPMGGQAMSSKDNWGDGMINEEDRGSA